MKNLFALFFVLTMVACLKDDHIAGIPDCIYDQIMEFKTNTACDNGAKVQEYKFNGKTVFTLNPGNCGADQCTSVIDKDCNYLGCLGGFAGNTQIDGKEFSKHAVWIRTCWKN